MRYLIHNGGEYVLYIDTLTGEAIWTADRSEAKSFTKAIAEEFADGIGQIVRK